MNRKISIKGWIEEDDKEKYTNIPIKCPNCREKLKKVDALQLCGILMVWCPNSRCRYCEIFEE